MDENLNPKRVGSFNGGEITLTKPSLQSKKKQNITLQVTQAMTFFFNILGGGA